LFYVFGIYLTNIRRVENDMRPGVRTAMQSSLATARNADKKAREEKKEKKKQNEAAKSAPSATSKAPLPSPSPSPPPPTAQTIKDFEKASSSDRKRLNDIAMAPPDLSARTKKLEKKASAAGHSSTRADGGVLSMRQKALMEEEREKVIERYRAMKQSQYAQREAEKEKEKTKSKAKAA
jgi:hypothetical protein